MFKLHCGALQCSVLMIRLKPEVTRFKTKPFQQSGVRNCVGSVFSNLRLLLFITVINSKGPEGGFGGWFVLRGSGAVPGRARAVAGPSLALPRLHQPG